jgi:hypothetical protein
MVETYHNPSSYHLALPRIFAYFLERYHHFNLIFNDESKTTFIKT